MKKIALFSFIFLLTFSAVVGQTIKVVKVENKDTEIKNWVDIQGLRGNYQIFVHYTYNFQTWGDVYAGTINIQSDQQVGIKMPKSCFTRSLMFWKFKFVKI